METAGAGAGGKRISYEQSYDQSILVYSIQPLSVFWTALLLLQDPAKQTQDLTPAVFVLSLIHILCVF